MPYLIFNVTEDQIRLWEEICESLVDGTADASLQDKMEVFGKEVDEKLEQLIDNFGCNEAFRIEFWGHDATEFSIMVISPNADHEEAIMELLSACPITNLHYGEVADW
ncbi:hypothetical protein [Cellvibrio sp. NN19]|uniref:hypothetical protein n=1 Tax=Cellvibrio chitinivorans TaxID=3102792 RepID=UPI002B410E36|nr:hypothetical protein [Cellvibrio sp. NN19]